MSEPKTTSSGADTPVVHLMRGGVSVVFSCRSGLVPQIAYWGAALRCEDTDSLVALVDGGVEAFTGNAPDQPSTAGVVPLPGDGWTGRPGLSGWREGGIDWSARFTLEQVKVQEAAVRFILADASAGLQLNLSYDLSPEGLLAARAELTNTGSVPYFLEELGVTFPVPLSADEILNRTGRWGRERVEQRQKVALGCNLKEGRHGRTGFDAPDMTFVGRSGFNFREGQVWGLHTAFSGNHRTWVEKLPSGVQVLGASELLLPGEIILQPGQSYQSPVFYALHADYLDQAANRVHQWLRSRPTHPRSPRPVTLNVWEAVYFDHRLPKLQQLADVAAEIGIERYVLDDGWFKGRRDDHAGLGDWFVDEEVWPHGLAPLADYVHGLGMQFGLWFEPEMVNEDSDLARAHPQWLMSARGAESDALPVRWRNQQVLNIAIEPAREYLAERVVSLVKQYNIDYIKWDHNRDLIEAGDQSAAGQAAVHRQTLAFYRLLDQIKEQCPGLEIESCSSGGGRIDLQVLQHTDRVWVSDCIDPVERQSIVRSLSQLLPPELMGTHVASPHSHTTGRWSNMASRGATALWGHMGVEWDLTGADPEELRQLGQWIAFHKLHRAFLHSGTLVRPISPDRTIWVSGVVSPDKNEALFQVVTRERGALAVAGKFTFAGLGQAKKYLVRPVFVGQQPSGLQAPKWFGAPAAATELETGGYEGITLTGEALMQAGLSVPPMHPEQVLLLHLQAKG